jgi:uncharacterized NAD(P)/FAD-binding protein YdhS
VNRLLIARMNVDPQYEGEFNEWYNGEHMRQASAIPGFGKSHRRYRALSFQGDYWTYLPNPEYTAIYDIERDAALLAAINSDQYKAWSGDFLERWRDRTHDEASIICEQIFGEESPIPYETVLIAQMNVSEGREEEFNSWYNDEHILQANRIPGFGSDHRRFRAIELRGKYWHYRALPRYTALYEIHPEADVLSAINSDEYREWSGDFLARWREGTTDEVSTICTRIY